MWSERNCGLPVRRSKVAAACVRARLLNSASRCWEPRVLQIVDRSRKRSCCGWMMPDASRCCSTPIPHPIRNVVYGARVLLIMTKANLLMRCARVCEPVNSDASASYSIRAATRADPERRTVRAQLARRFCDTVLLRRPVAGEKSVIFNTLGSCGRGMRFAKAVLAKHNQEAP